MSTAGPLSVPTGFFGAARAESLRAALRHGLLGVLVAAAAIAASAPRVARAAPAPRPEKPEAEAPSADPSSRATATLPLSEYERLVARPSVTVIDTLRVLGSFAGRDLSLQVVGRAAGVLPKVELLAGGQALRLHACEGDAILTRGDGGSFELVPQAGRFTLRCRIAVPGSDSLQLQIAPAVLWAESQVSDGELVRLEDLKEREGWRVLQVVRLVEGSVGEPLQPSLSARYHLMLQPEATEFSYRFEIRNPNRAHLDLSIPLGPGEQVQRVETAASYELGGGAVQLKLPPGDSTVLLSGALRGESFQPRVAASVQYALIDSHPLLRPVITTAAQRISAAETGLDPRFSYAQAFLLDKGQALTWQVQRLSALRTTSFAVNTARHTFFLGSDGAVLGETAFLLSNQGAPALTLRSRAEPTFASLQDAPVLLTKDEAGALFLPLGQGKLDVLVQHRQALHRGLGLAWGTLQLPDPGVPASQGAVELRYEQRWLPLYESMAQDPRSPALGLAGLLGLLALLLVTERLLGALELGRGVRITAAALLCGAAATSGLWLALLILADLGLGVLLVLPWVIRRRPSFWTVVGGLAVGGFFCLILASSLLLRGSAPARSPDLLDTRYASVSTRVSKEGGKSAPAGSPGAPAPEEAAAPAYQGLPAKIVMPQGSERSVLSRELLSAELHPVRVLMVARPLVALGGDLLLALALILLALCLPTLRSSLRERWARVFGPRPE